MVNNRTSYRIISGMEERMTQVTAKWGTAAYKKQFALRRKDEAARKDEDQRIGRCLKGRGLRNDFKTREQAEIEIINMGLPFKCIVAELFWI